MVARFFKFSLGAACVRKLRTLRAQAKTFRKARTLSNKCPNVRTLPSFWQGRARKCDPFANLRQKCEPFPNPRTKYKPFRGFGEHVFKSANPLRGFAKSVKAFDVLANTCPKVRTLFRFWRACAQSAIPFQCLAKACPKVRTLGESSPQVRTLSNVWRGRAQKHEPLKASARKSEPFAGPCCASPPVTLEMRTLPQTHPKVPTLIVCLQPTSACNPCRSSRRFKHGRRRCTRRATLLRHPKDV